MYCILSAMHLKKLRFFRCGLSPYRLLRRQLLVSKLTDAACEASCMALRIAKKICLRSPSDRSFSIQDKQITVYACSTLPARRHLVQTFILLTPPSALTLTFWTLEFQILLDLLCEWLTLFPKCAPLPQTSHFAIMTPPHVSKFRRQHTYISKDISQMQG